MTPEIPVNPASTSPRNLIGLYSAWRMDDKVLGDPTKRRPDFHVEMRLATFAVEPSDILKLSACMARREAFPLGGIQVEEIGTLFVDNAIATSMEGLDGWFDLPASGDLSLARRTSSRFETLGRTRFVTDPADLAATLKRHGLPEAWAADHGSEAWARALHRGPDFEEFVRRANDFVGEYNEREARHRKKAASKFGGGIER